MTKEILEKQLDSFFSNELVSLLSLLSNNKVTENAIEVVKIIAIEEFLPLIKMTSDFYDEQPFDKFEDKTQKSILDLWIISIISRIKSNPCLSPENQFLTLFVLKSLTKK